MSKRNPTFRAAKHLVPVACLLALAIPAAAQTAPKVVTLTFEGLHDGETVNNYYNGGLGGDGTGPGPNYGITFGQDTLALISTGAGGNGFFSGNPSGNTVAFFVSGPGVIMNVAAGFTTGFSFYYAATQPGSVTVYDGPDGTGNVLSTINLPENVSTSNCPTDAGGNLIYCNWQVSNNAFAGTAKSVNFSGSADFIGFDNITVGASTATPPLTVVTSSFANGAAGTAYNGILTASGGTPPYTWSATNLPPGLAVNGAAITGTPTTAGTYSNVTLKVTDSSAPTLSATNPKPITIVITAAPLQITSTSLPAGVINQSYSTQVGSTGGLGPFFWSATGLPGGLSLNQANGTITGSPNATGSFNVTVTLEDSSNPPQMTTHFYTLVVGTGLTVGTTTLPGGTVGISYSAPLTATGGTQPYTWSASGLPVGLSVNGQNITGTPTAAGSSTVTLSVTDSSTPALTATGSATIAIVAPAAVSITTASLPAATAGAAYSASLTVTGGIGPFTWSASGLPAGLAINPSTGAISGTPSAGGTANVSVTVNDSSSPALTTTKTFSLTVNGALKLTCTTANGPTFVGAKYSNTCTAAGGTSPYGFSLSAGALPAGLASSTGPTTFTISGTPSAAASFNFTVQTKDAAGAAQTQAFTGTIGSTPSVSSFSLTAVPSTANQYTANLSFTSAPQTPLSGTVCLNFKADASVPNGGSYVSQEVQFANGTTNASCGPTPKNTLNFTVAAGSTTATWSGSNSQFSQGTVAGTITLTVSTLSDQNGVSVLSTTTPSQTTTVAAGQPTVSNTASFTTTASTITVTFDGVTSKRSLASATYTFQSSSGPNTVTVSFTSGTFSGMDQSLWFGTAASLATGGAFSLSATFPCTGCSAITGVQVALAN